MHIVPRIEQSEQGLVVSSETIAEGAGIEHRAVLQMIASNQEDLGTFGPIAFEMRKGEALPQGGFGRSTRIALLNEQQASLMMTYLRNTEQVKQFKLALITGFYEMAQELQNRQPAELSRREILTMALEAEERADEYKAQVEQDAPKVDAYESFMDSDGTYSVGNVAKMLGRSQNKLFTDLRNHGVLIGKGAMRNTPYQQYMHHFTVKAYSYTRSDGNEGTSYTTRVQPSGVNFIRRKLELPEQLEATA